jgi:hypothetical protein
MSAKVLLSLQETIVGSLISDNRCRFPLELLIALLTDLNLIGPLIVAIDIPD